MELAEIVSWEAGVTHEGGHVGLVGGERDHLEEVVAIILADLLQGEERSGLAEWVGCDLLHLLAGLRGRGEVLELVLDDIERGRVLEGERQALLRTIGDLLLVHGRSRLLWWRKAEVVLASLLDSLS